MGNDQQHYSERPLFLLLPRKHHRRHQPRDRKFDGEIFLLYIGWYGAGRFWIEALRTDSLFIPGTPFKVSQLVAGTCVLFSIILLIINYVSVKKNGYTFYYETDESKELLRLRDEKIKKKRRPDDNAALDEHILADGVDNEEETDDSESEPEQANEYSESVETAEAESAPEEESETETEENENGESD